MYMCTIVAPCIKSTGAIRITMDMIFVIMIIIGIIIVIMSLNMLIINKGSKASPMGESSLVSAKFKELP